MIWQTLSRTVPIHVPLWEEKRTKEGMKNGTEKGNGKWHRKREWNTHWTCAFTNSKNTIYMASIEIKKIREVVNPELWEKKWRKNSQQLKFFDYIEFWIFLRYKYNIHSKSQFHSMHSQSINQSINWLIDRWFNNSNDRSINQSINWSIDDSIIRSINQSNDARLNQTIGRNVRIMIKMTGLPH